MMARRFALTSVLVLLLVVAVAPAAAQALTVKTDKATYIPGETVIVSGFAPAGQYVSIDIVNPDGKIVDTKMVLAGADGSYVATFKLPSTIPYGDWKPGRYTVRAYVGSLVATTSFDLIVGGVVKGRVVDETGTPVADATVVVTETGASTTTGADGRFSLVTGAGDFTIVVSKQGYTSATVKVTVGAGEIKDLGDIRIVSYMYLFNVTLTELLARVQTLENTVKGLNESLSSVASTVEDLRKALSALSGKVDAVSGSVEDLRKAVGALGTALAAINASIGEVSKALNELSGSIAAITDAVKAVSSKVDTVSSKVDAVSSSVAALTGTVNAVSRAVSDLRTAVDSLTGKVDAVSSKVDSVSTAVTGVSNAVNAVSSKVDSAIKAISDLNTAVTGVGGKVDTVSSKVDTVNNKVDAVSGAVGALQTYIIVTLVLALIGAVTGIYAVVLLSRKLAA